MSDRCGVCHLRHLAGGPPTCRATTRRWPIAPVMQVVGDDSERALADTLGVVRRTVSRALAIGTVDDAMADRIATALHKHPVELWGWDWIDAALTPLDRQRLDTGWRTAWLHLEESA